MKVLAVGAHPDDVELGAGGTLWKHAQAGDEVTILVMGSGAMSRDGATETDVQNLQSQAFQAATVLGASMRLLTFPDQRYDSVDFLQLVRAVERVVEELEPEVVYTHHGDDLNLDHRLTHQAVMTACRPLPKMSVRRIQAFEVVSTTEWGKILFHPTSFVELTTDAFEAKAEALTAYVGEMRSPPHPRSLGVLEALARWRGSMAGVAKAEAFELLREIR